ncbi:uncharacterized protein LOC133191510 [Saccostrea echinata]|uniref:uncharacterized protein LOC133191510 n=1 Tax=Saccostrea echinata TaxID=191078 RepID=UPI002A808E1D|nr:uncharacterized protein LOC133191510 [Saccostrea echinata]
MSYVCIVNVWLLCVCVCNFCTVCTPVPIDPVTSLQDNTIDEINDDIPVDKRSVRLCKGHPNVLQCIRSYFSSRFKLMHRAVKDPVDLRNIGKRGKRFSGQIAVEVPQWRLDRLNSLYKAMIKKAASDFRNIGKKRAADDFKSVSRRSIAADFRNIGKRYYGADWRNIGKRLSGDFRNIGKRSFAADFRNIGKKSFAGDFRDIGKRSFAADFRNIGKRRYAADFRNIGKRLGVDFRNIGKRTLSNLDNDMALDDEILTLLCPDSISLVECSDRIAINA